MLRLLALTALTFSIACNSGAHLPDDREELARIADNSDFAVAVPAAQKIAKSFGEDGVYHLIDNGGENARGWGCSLLVGYPSDRARKTLKGALLDASPHVRLQAMIALGTICGKDCTGDIKSLQSDPDPEVRRVQGAMLQKLQR